MKLNKVIKLHPKKHNKDTLISELQDFANRINELVNVLEVGPKIQDFNSRVNLYQERLADRLKSKSKKAKTSRRKNIKKNLICKLDQLDQ